MAKYKLTESQMQMVFESIIKAKLNEEMDNHNYPAGSDTPDAPWNQEEPNMSEPIVETGSIGLLDFDGFEYLLKNSVNGDILYTLGDAMNGDIYHALHDFLAIPQVDDGNGVGDQDDWEAKIQDDELAQALVSYANYVYKRNMLTLANSVQEWEGGQEEFLLVSPEVMSYEDLGQVILSEKLRAKVSELFNGATN